MFIVNNLPCNILSVKTVYNTLVSDMCLINRVLYIRNKETWYTINLVF